MNSNEFIYLGGVLMYIFECIWIIGLPVCSEIYGRGRAFLKGNNLMYVMYFYCCLIKNYILYWKFGCTSKTSN